MQNQNTKNLIDAINRFAGDPARAVESLSPEARDAIVLDLANAIAHRRVSRPQADARQGWLALPEYEKVPQFIRVGNEFVDTNEATILQLRETESDLRKRIRSYLYPRRSEAKLKRDRETLRQLSKTDKQAAPFTVGAPEMKIGPAIQMHLASLETPASNQRRKAIKYAMKRRHART
jgi:hypothetical protein